MTLEASQLYQQPAVDQPPAKQNYIIKIGVRSFFSHQVAFLACRYQPLRIYKTVFTPEYI